tara:strand:- start:412 stop:918 length:507 start_codon:yes stop_codon:yes gene_type:complete
MRPGSLNLNFFILVFFLNFCSLSSQEKINLENLQPSFEEEESDSNNLEKDKDIDDSKIKSKKKKNFGTNEIVVKLRALDKITAKTSDINILLGNKKRFGYLEILPKKCSKPTGVNNKGVAAYIQVRDLSEKKSDKVFVFNGWTFSSSTTLRTFDHPIYDLWLTGCENI